MINKRTLIILGVIILLSITAGVVLLMGRKQALPPEPQAVPEIKKLVDEEAVSPVPSFDGTAIWYFTTNGRLFRTNAEGSELSEFPLPSLTAGTLESVAWPSTGNDFIAVVNSSVGKLKSYYDNVRKEYFTLPSNVQNFDWMPDSKRILYVWKSGDNATQQLVLANADGTGFRPIKDVFWPDLKVKVSSSGKEALLIRERIEGLVNKIYRANLQSGFIDTIIEEGKNLDALWLSSGRGFVFSQAGITTTPKIYLYDFTSRKVTDLNLTTSLDKVMIDKEGRFLYAAVAKKDNTGDEFVKVDLVSFNEEIYFTPDSDIRAKNLIEVDGKLYFVNTRDGKLYYISK